MTPGSMNAKRLSSSPWIKHLAERLRQHPAGSRARLYTNWSYLEGIRAEELSRCNLQAEREALRAEAINSLAWALGFCRAGLH